MSELRIYGANEVEYAKLKLFANKVNNIVCGDFFVSIETTHVDYGQDWEYTTLITESFEDDSTWSTWQSLNFRDYKKLVTCDSFKQIEEWACKYAEGLLDGQICIDL